MRNDLRCIGRGSTENKVADLEAPPRVPPIAILIMMEEEAAEWGASRITSALSSVTVVAAVVLPLQSLVAWVILGTTSIIRGYPVTDNPGRKIMVATHRSLIC